MHADIVVDDEFQTRKAHALIRNLAEVKGKLRVADVHHDLHGDLGKRPAAHFFNGKVLDAAVDVTGVAFGAPVPSWGRSCR